MNRPSIAVIVFSAMLPLCGVPARAALVETSFGGTVTANNPVEGFPAIGSSISGNYVINTDVLTGDGPNCVAKPLCWSGPDTSGTYFDFLPAVYAITFGEKNAVPGAGSDVLTVDLLGEDLIDVTLTLTDPTGSAFENGGGVNLFSSAQFRFFPECLTSIDCVFDPYYSGTITSITSTSESSGAVPEPATTPLLSLIGSLVWISRVFNKRQRTGHAPSENSLSSVFRELVNFEMKAIRRQMRC